jgi:hypothetical protein
MPRSTFAVHDGEYALSDETGVWFAEPARAIEHGQTVACELM